VVALTPLLARHEDATPNFDCQNRTSATSQVIRDLLLRAIDSLLAANTWRRCGAVLLRRCDGAHETNDVSLASTSWMLSGPVLDFTGSVAQLGTAIEVTELHPMLHLHMVVTNRALSVFRTVRALFLRGPLVTTTSFV